MKALKAYFEKDWWDAKNNETKLFKQPLIMFPEKTGLGENNNIAILTIDSDGKQVTVDDIYLKVVDDWGEDVDSETRDKLEKMMNKFSDTIDWEQRWYDVAKEICAQVAGSGFEYIDFAKPKEDMKRKTMEYIADYAIYLADEFISEIKSRNKR